MASPISKEQVAISIQDLDYTTKTLGWQSGLGPYWSKFIHRQMDRIRIEERNLREGKESRIQYELGKLDGYRDFMNAPESIRKGYRLRAGIKSNSPSAPEVR